MEVKDYFAVNSQCKNCDNYILNFTCLAFPKKIPEEIYINKTVHKRKVKGQKNNITFEQKKII